MKKERIIGVSILIAICVIFSGMYVVRIREKNSGQTELEEAIWVETNKVTKGEIANYTKYTGSIKGNKEVAIVPEMPSPIIELNVKEGDYVNKGDIIMKLDSSAVDKQVEEAKKAYDTALEAQKGQANNSPIDKKEIDKRIADLDKDIKKDEESLKTLSEQFTDIEKQINDLEEKKKKGEINEAQYNMQMMQLKPVKEQLTKAVDGLKQKIALSKTIKEGISKAVEAAEGLTSSMVGGASSIDNIKEMYEQTLALKDKYIVKAPISGFVKDLTVGEGDTPISILAPPLKVVDTSGYRVDIQVSEDGKSDIHLDEEVDLEIEMNNKKIKAKGIIDYIGDKKDNKSNQYLCSVVVKDTGKELEYGSYVRVLVKDKVKNNVLVINKNSIIRENGKAFVYKNNNGKFDKIEIKLGFYNDNYVEVTSGIKENDEIVIKGKDFIEEGKEIKVVGGAK